MFLNLKKLYSYAKLVEIDNKYKNQNYCTLLLSCIYVSSSVLSYCHTCMYLRLYSLIPVSYKEAQCQYSNIRLSGDSLLCGHVDIS